MKIGVSKAVLDSEIRNEQQKSLNELINDFQSNGVNVIVFEPKDKSFTISLTNGLIYETEAAFRDFYSDFKLKNISANDGYSKITAFLLGIIPFTGILGMQAFYTKANSRIFHIITDIVLALITLLLLTAPKCISSCAVTAEAIYAIFSVLWIIPMYVVSLIESFWLLFRKSNYIEPNKKQKNDWLHASIILFIIFLFIVIFV